MKKSRSPLTSDFGCLASREIFHLLAVDEWLKTHLIDKRQQVKVKHELLDAIIVKTLMTVQGWKAQSNIKLLERDPALCLAVSAKRSHDTPDTYNSLMSQSSLSRLICWLSSLDNINILNEGLFVFAGRRIRMCHPDKKHGQFIIDIDSIPISASGNQKGVQYNGHYREKIFHPLIATSADTQDLLAVELREGNVFTSQNAVSFIDRLIDGAKKYISSDIAFRFDSGFCHDEILSKLENENIHYVSRIKNNNLLRDKFYLETDHDRQPDYVDEDVEIFETQYKAKSWDSARRVLFVAPLKYDCEQRSLFKNYFVIISSWSKQEKSAIELLKCYRERGNAENVFGEFKSVIDINLSSTNRPKSMYGGKFVILDNKYNFNPCSPFHVNYVNLIIHAYSYQIMHSMRVCQEFRTKKGCSLRRIREQYLKVAARITKHSRQIFFHIDQHIIKHCCSLLNMFIILDVKKYPEKIEIQRC